MATDAYADIPVKAICYTAGVSRRTFYNNFSSKDEIILNYASDTLHRAILRRAAAEPVGISSIIDAGQEAFAKDRRLYNLMVSQPALSPLLHEAIRTTISNIVSEYSTQRDTTLREYHAAIIAGALTEALSLWETRSEDLSVDALASLLTESLSVSIRALFG